MSNIKNLVGPDFSYTDALNHMTEESIKRAREAGDDFQKSPLRPSAAGKCERELAYDLMEYRKLAQYEKELNTPELHRLFALGHSIESHILWQFKEQFKPLGISVRYQQQNLSFMHLSSTVDPKYDAWVEGSIDFVLWSDKFKAIGDVKSKKEKFSSYRESTWEEDNEKYSKMKTLQKIGEEAFYAEDVEAFLIELNDPFLAMNVLQLNLYANNIFITERNIDHCVLIYYSKNTSRIRELRFKPSKSLHDYVLNKFKYAYEAVEAGNPELAKKEFALGTIKCAFCAYKKECWKADDPLRLYFKSLPPKSWPKDTSRLGDDGLALEELFEQYMQAELEASAVKNLESEIIDILTEIKVNKIRLANGYIYEVKLYKSPNEHFKLKRSKV